MPLSHLVKGGYAFSYGYSTPFRAQGIHMPVLTLPVGDGTPGPSVILACDP